MLKMIDLFSVASTRNETKMALFIVRHLEKLNIPFNIDDFGNIYIVKGVSDTYPMFTAHLDTVHTYNNGFNCIEKDGILYAEDNSGFPVGVGGDCKNGLYICLKLLEVIPTIKIVFFSGEEVGGIGSRSFNKTWLEDCRFIGGVDRKGINDFVTKYRGITVSQEFLQDIDPLLIKYSRTQSDGLFTDALSFSSLNISCFNMSCGYYNPHTNNEYVKISEIEETLEFCKEIAETCTKKYIHTKQAPVTHTPTYYQREFNDWEDDFYPNYYGKSYFNNPKKNKQLNLFPKIEEDDKIDDIAESEWERQIREEAEEWKRWFPND